MNPEDGIDLPDHKRSTFNGRRRSPTSSAPAGEWNFPSMPSRERAREPILGFQGE